MDVISQAHVEAREVEDGLADDTSHVGDDDLSEEDLADAEHLIDDAGTSHVGDEVSEEDLEDASHLLEDDLEKEEELLIAQQEKKPASRRRRRTEEVK